MGIIYRTGNGLHVLKTLLGVGILKLYSVYKKLTWPAFLLDELQVYRRNSAYYWLRQKISSDGKMFITMGVLLFCFPAVANILNFTAFNGALLKEIRSMHPILAKMLCGNNGGRDLQLPFFLDFGIIVYTLILYPAHTIVVMRLWDIIAKTLKDIESDSIVIFGKDELSNLIIEFNGYFNRRRYNVFAFILATAFTSWIYFWGRGQIEWWGNIRYGMLGLSAFVFISMVIWYQLFLHNFKGIVAVCLLRRIFSRGSKAFHFKFVHEDKSNGLSGIGTIFLLAYLSTVIHIISVYVAIEFNLLQKEFDLMLIVIIVIFVVFVPIFHYYPFHIVSQSMVRYKQEQLGKVSSLLMKNYERIIFEFDIESIFRRRATLGRIHGMSVLQNLYVSIDLMQTHPYPVRKLRLAIITYLVQAAIVSMKVYEFIYLGSSAK